MQAFSLRPTWKMLLIAIVLGWAYLTTLIELIEKWFTDPQYSHGFIVPGFALYLLYRQRDRKPAEAKSWPLIGYSILIVAFVFRTMAAATDFLPLDGLSLVFCLTGLAAIAGGHEALRWSGPALIFLLFMIPLPYQVERMLGAELQHIATLSSTFMLQTLGQSAIAEGNVIIINDNIPLGIVEACSGLRMLMTFFAFSVAAIFVMDRHWIVKAIVLASAVPIALITNVLRITATGLAHIWVHDSPHRGEVIDFIHDFNGLMMMPVGLAFLMLELWILQRLIVEPKEKAVPMTTFRMPLQLSAVK